METKYEFTPEQKYTILLAQRALLIARLNVEAATKAVATAEVNLNKTAADAIKALGIDDTTKVTIDLDAMTLQ